MLSIIHEYEQLRFKIGELDIEHKRTIMQETVLVDRLVFSTVNLIIIGHSVFSIVKGLTRRILVIV